MAYYSPEIIQEIKKIDLYTYLKNYDPEELIYFSKDTYITKSHDSLKISNGFWYWFSRNIGGKTALEYLIRVKDFTFIQAVETILEKTKISPLVEYKQKEKVKDYVLQLPKKANDNNIVINYLVGRGIDKDIILECIDNDLIYQEYQNNNVVFLGYDKNKVARYAGIRGTNSTRYMHDAYGSHKAFSFKLESIKSNDSVHIFESAIDLLSYATILKLEKKEWFNENLVSLAGIYQPAKKFDESKIPLALNYYLNQNPNINKVILHLDNDIAGKNASIAIKSVMPKQYEVIDDPPLIGKDYNDFLCEKLGKNYNKKIGKER